MRRHAIRVALLALVLLLLLVGWIRRNSAVRAPEAGPDAVDVRILATGIHSGLLLPCGDGRIVEYGYGEWGWYALDHSSWWRAPVIALLPSQGALGRRYLSASALGAKGGAYGGGTLATIRVPRAAAEMLLAKLDLAFARGGEPYRNELYDMYFVKSGERFHLFHECHDETAEWLRELGCEVGWSPIRTGLSVEPRMP